MGELLQKQERCANRGDWDGYCKIQLVIDAIVAASGEQE